MKILTVERQGEQVRETLFAQPVVEAEGKGWKKIHLPTHTDHFYDIVRYEFDDAIEIETSNQCHILMLVEGTSIELSVNEDTSLTFNYVETFAAPAAAEKYRLKNKGNGMAKVIVSFVKD